MRRLVRLALDVSIYVTLPLALLFLLLQEWWIAGLFLAVSVSAATVNVLLARR